MLTPAVHRRRLGAIATPLLGLAALAYFGYHAVSGDRGLLTWWQLRQDLGDALAQSDALAAQRQVLEHRVALLKRGHLDPDMLDERARMMLNMIGPNEVVIVPPAQSGSGVGGGNQGQR